MTVELNSVEKAIEYLGELQNGRTPEEVTFSGELAKLHIEVKGARYHATVPGELARGLWQFQEAIYSAAAYALTGFEDIRKLTAEQRSALELVFEVKEASSDFWAALAGFFDKLGEGFVNMEPKERICVIVILAVLIAGGYCFGKGADVFSDIRKDEIAAASAAKHDSLQIQQMEMFVNAIAGHQFTQKFDQAITEGTRAIARSAPDADQIDIGRTQVDASRIEDLNRRAPRVPTQPDMLNMSFHIFEVNVRERGIAKYVLAGPGTGEFVATINEANFTQAELAKVLGAAHKREEIKLEVLIGRRQGAIRAAEIMQVF